MDAGGEGGEGAGAGEVEEVVDFIVGEGGEGFGGHIGLFRWGWECLLYDILIAWRYEVLYIYGRSLVHVCRASRTAVSWRLRGLTGY